MKSVKTVKKVQRSIGTLACCVALTGAMPVAVSAEEAHVHQKECYTESGDLICKEEAASEEGTDPNASANPASSENETTNPDPSAADSGTNAAPGAADPAQGADPNAADPAQDADSNAADPASDTDQDASAPAGTKQGLRSSLLRASQVTVTTYQELADALSNQTATIILGADIDVNATLTVDYDCTIQSDGTHGLIRAEGFTDKILSVTSDTDNGVTVCLNQVRIDGKNIEAQAPAVYVGRGNTLTADKTTICNNINSNIGSREDGGGICAEYSNITLTGCRVENCSGYRGGGIYAYTSFRAASAFTMSGTTISGNKAQAEGGGVYLEQYTDVNISQSYIDGNESDDEGGGLHLHRCADSDVSTEEEALSAEHVVIITDTSISGNTALWGGGLIDYGTPVKVCGKTKISGNTAKRSGGGVRSTEVGVMLMYDDSTISDNVSEGSGGGAYLEELVLIMHDNSSICGNSAKENGGGAYVGYELLKMYDKASIHDNSAGGSGGGVYCSDDTYLYSGMVYDNAADAEGDDIFNDWEDLYFLFPTQDNRIYGSGNSSTLGTIPVELIEGYDKLPTVKDNISVPFYGWFEDSSKTPYTDVKNSHRITETTETGDGTSASLSYQTYKAIWFGYLLAYDANYPGSTEYKYDEQAYALEASAAIADNMFTREGYRFTGWNTESDGTGTPYQAGNELVMKGSQVLYAQWEAERYTVTYAVNQDASYGAPEDSVTPTDDTEYTYKAKVTVKPGLTTTQGYAVVNGQKVSGTWSFTGWDRENFEITENTVITGSWKFTPDTPSTPNTPDTPSTPDTPGTTDTPSTPATPSVPQTDTVTPEQTVVPANTTVPVAAAAVPARGAVRAGDDTHAGTWGITGLLAALGLIGFETAGKHRRKQKR